MRSVEILNELLALNRSGDISEDLRKRIFVPVFWVMAALAGLGLVLTGGMMESAPVPRLIQLTTILFFLITWLLWKNKRTILAAHLLIWGAWSLASLVALSEGGQASHWLVPQFLLIVLARFVLTGRAAIALGLATVALDFSIYAYRLQQYLPMELRDLPLGNDWAAILIGFLFLLFIFFVADSVLRETLRQARFTEGRYRSLFDRTNDAVFLVGTDQRYLDVNQQAADLLGYTREELLTKSVLDVIPMEEAQSVRSNFERLQNESSLPLFERTLICADGSRRKAEVSITAVEDEHGKTIYFQSVMRDITERKRLEEQLRLSLNEMEVLAMQDPLTGLLNRRAITDHADAEWHRAQRERRPVCIMLIDLDNLKDVNDSAGHLVGDQVIVELAATIRHSLRRYDWAGRWGGDEFMLVLPGSNLVDAQEIGERLRTQFNSSELIAGLSAPQLPHLSIGVACYSGRPGEEINLNQLFGQADKALYRAKETGRNRVEIYRDEVS